MTTYWSTRLYSRLIRSSFANVGQVIVGTKFVCFFDARHNVKNDAVYHKGSGYHNTEQMVAMSGVKKLPTLVAAITCPTLAFEPSIIYFMVFAEILLYLRCQFLEGVRH